MKVIGSYDGFLKNNKLRERLSLKASTIMLKNYITRSNDCKLYFSS